MNVLLLNSIIVEARIYLSHVIVYCMHARVDLNYILFSYMYCTVHIMRKCKVCVYIQN